MQGIIGIQEELSIKMGLKKDRLALVYTVFKLSALRSPKPFR